MDRKLHVDTLTGGCTIIITTKKKKDTVVCLAGARSLLRLEKKVLVVFLVGARSLLRPEKKVLVVCLEGAKKDTVVCLADARSKNNDQKKKRYSHLAVHKVNYDRKKKVQPSGRLCFSNHQKKLRPKKKVQYSRLTDG